MLTVCFHHKQEKWKTRDGSFVLWLTLIADYIGMAALAKINKEKIGTILGAS
jgi:hypothetical protein